MDELSADISGPGVTLASLDLEEIAEDPSIDEHDRLLTCERNVSSCRVKHLIEKSANMDADDLQDEMAKMLRSIAKSISTEQDEESEPMDDAELLEIEMRKSASVRNGSPSISHSIKGAKANLLRSDTKR